MLSYPIDEAEELLATKLSTAKQSCSNCEEDLDFLREQITVSRAPWTRHEAATDPSSRPWKSILPASTPGTWCRSERKSPRRRVRGRTPRAISHSCPACHASPPPLPPNPQGGISPAPTHTRGARPSTFFPLVASAQRCVWFPRYERLQLAGRSCRGRAVTPVGPSARDMRIGHDRQRYM